MSDVREMTVKEMLGLLEWHEQMGYATVKAAAAANGAVEDEAL